MSKQKAWYVYAVYYGASDLPPGFAVRRYDVSGGGSDSELICVGQDTVEAARSHIPGGLIRINRCSSDDPVIVESWI